MKKTKLLLILSLLALFTTLMASLKIQFTGSMAETISDGHWVIHGSTISINNNGDFATYASSGNGSASNPWIIENLVLNGNGTGIIFDIQDTDAHFIIRNCYLYNTTSNAIDIFQAGNGTILNNTITNCNTAIYIERGSNFQVINNTLTLNTLNGFETNDGATYIELVNNTITHNGYTGVYLWGTNHSLLSENTIKNNTNNGLTFDNLCVNNTIAYNTLDNNTDGLELLDRSNFNRIRYNTMNNNSAYGIYFDNGQNNYNMFLNNTINFNGDSGLYSWGSSHNTLINNTFNGNQYEGINLVGSSFNFTLTSNEASFNKNDGIQIDCPNNTVTYNWANNNTGYGIHLDYGHNNTISLNTANGNGILGVFVENCNDTTVTWNVLHYNPTSVLPSGGFGNIIVNNSAGPANLTAGTVIPSTGDTANTFTFTVVYFDIDNLAPFSIRVIVDGTPHDMVKDNPGDNTYTDGCRYVYATQLPEGVHSYSFEVYDITHKVTTTQSAGPNVTAAPIPGFEILMLLVPLLGLALTHLLFNKRRFKF